MLNWSSFWSKPISILICPPKIFLLFTLRISRQISHKEIVCRFKSFRKSAQQRCLTLSGSSFWSESWECRDARPHSEGGTQFSWSVWNWKRVSLKKFRKENHFSWGWFVFKPVNATRSEQGGVKDVNPVCGHDHLGRKGSSSLVTDWYKQYLDVFGGLEPIQLIQQFQHGPLNLKNHVIHWFDHFHFF